MLIFFGKPSDDIIQFHMTLPPDDRDLALTEGYRCYLGKHHVRARAINNQRCKRSSLSEKVDFVIYLSTGYAAK